MADRPRIRDLSIFVVGFAIAAGSSRHVLPDAGHLDVARACIATFVAGWAGLAMAGPWILMGLAGSFNHKLKPETPGRLIGDPTLDLVAQDRPVGTDQNPRTSGLTAGEVTWIALGAYYMTTSALTRWPLHAGIYSPVANGVVAIIAIGSRVARVGLRGKASPTRWTERFAVGLIWSMPLVWLGTWILSLPV